MNGHLQGTAFLACLLALAATGCARHRVSAAPPVSATPSATEPAAKPPADAAGAKSDSTKETAATPSLVIPPPRPATPARPAPETPSTSEPSAPRPAPPQISPRLSAEVQAQYRKETSEAIAAAEKDLQSLLGRRVTTAERDLIEKIRGFLAQAHEALAASDLVRARTLAEKARVLSAELVGRR